MSHEELQPNRDRQAAKGGKRPAQFKDRPQPDLSFFTPSLPKRGELVPADPTPIKDLSPKLLNSSERVLTGMADVIGPEEAGRLLGMVSEQRVAHDIEKMDEEIAKKQLQETGIRSADIANFLEFLTKSDTKETLDEDKLYALEKTYHKLEMAEFKASTRKKRRTRLATIGAAVVVGAGAMAGGAAWAVQSYENHQATVAEQEAIKARQEAIDAEKQKEQELQARKNLEQHLLGTQPTETSGRDFRVLYPKPGTTFVDAPNELDSFVPVSPSTDNNELYLTRTLPDDNSTTRYDTYIKIKPYTRLDGAETEEIQIYDGNDTLTQSVLLPTQPTPEVPNPNVLEIQTRDGLDYTFKVEHGSGQDSINLTKVHPVGKETIK